MKKITFESDQVKVKTGHKVDGSGDVSFVIGDMRYSIDQNGNIYSFAKKKMMKPSLLKNGYKSLVLGNGSHRMTTTVHRLVALTHLDNPNNHKCVNHKDGNKQNNNVNNLEWVSHSENNKHAYRLGLKSNFGEKHSKSVLTWEIVEMLRGMKSKNMKLNYSDYARKYKVTPSTLRHAVVGLSWRHK